MSVTDWHTQTLAHTVSGQMINIFWWRALANTLCSQFSSWTLQWLLLQLHSNTDLSGKCSGRHLTATSFTNIRQYSSINPLDCSFKASAFLKSCQLWFHYCVLPLGSSQSSKMWLSLCCKVTPGKQTKKKITNRYSFLLKEHNVLFFAYS